MKTRAITCPVIVEGISTRKDGSLGIRMTTPELKPDEKLAFLEVQGRSCKILIQSLDEEGEALKEIKGEFDKKTPSQRARSILFVYWKHLTETNQCEISFDTFYIKEYEKLINGIKEKLPQQSY
jgi:hypothetical protein